MFISLAQTTQPEAAEGRHDMLGESLLSHFTAENRDRGRGHGMARLSAQGG